MKTFYTLIALLLTAGFAVANPVITLKTNNGKWRNNSTWDLNRTPADGDTVIVPVGKTLIIDNTVNLQNANLYIKVYGTIDLDGGKLKLDNNSTVILASSGSITAHGNNSEYIKIGNDYKFRGSVYYQSGPSYADTTTSAFPSGFASNGSVALPVKFVYFNASRQEKNILIQWATAQEVNSRFFEVEKSENGSSWKSIATVTAAGTSNSLKNYSYTETNVTAAVVYYRIKEVDMDGRLDFTTVRSIKTDNTTAAEAVKISSGTNNEVYIRFSAPVKNDVQVKVISLNGQVVNSQKISNPSGVESITLNNNTAKGIYVVNVTDVNGLNITGKIML